MNLSLRLKLLTLSHRALIVMADAQPTNGDKWITTEGGSRVLLDKNGIVKGGMGGKFTGLNMSDVKKQKDSPSHASVTSSAISKTKAGVKQQGLTESGYYKDLEKHKNNEEAIKRHWAGRGNAKKEHNKVMEKYKKELAEYKALKPADKRKKDVYGRKINEQPEMPRIEKEPNYIPKPDLKGYLRETGNDFNQSTQHQTEPADIFSERGMAKTSHEFENAEHAENYLENIDDKLTSSGYERNNGVGLVSYTKGNHVFNVSHNLDDDNESDYLDDGDYIGKVSVKSGYIDSSLAGSEPIKKVETNAEREQAKPQEIQGVSNSFETFTANKTALQKGKILSDLSKNVNSSNLPDAPSPLMTVKGVIEHFINSGGSVKSSSYFDNLSQDRDYKKLENTTRMSQKEVVDLERKIADKKNYTSIKDILELKDFGLTTKSIGKTGMDYAKHLQANQPSPEAKPTSKA